MEVELPNRRGDLVSETYILMPDENDALLGATQYEFIIGASEHARVDKPGLKSSYLSWVYL